MAIVNNSTDTISRNMYTDTCSKLTLFFFLIIFFEESIFFFIIIKNA